MNKSISLMLALIVLVLVGLTMGEDGTVAKIASPAASHRAEPAASTAPASAQPRHVNPWAADDSNTEPPARADASIVVLPAFDNTPNKVTLPSETVDPAVASASEIR